ncbi:MAG: hypothetical protein ABW215_04215 [Kibdelosporangium sp.]
MSATPGVSFASSRCPVPGPGGCWRVVQADPDWERTDDFLLVSDLDEISALAGGLLVTHWHAEDMPVRPGTDRVDVLRGRAPQGRPCLTA